MTEKRKVLQLVPSFGGGGAETQLAYLCAGLVQRDWRVDVLHFVGGPTRERFQSSGAAIHTVPVRGNYDPAILWRLRRVIRDLEPDLVQTWIPMMDTLGGISARIQGVPWVLSERSSPLLFPRTLKLRLREHVARGASAVVSNSVGGDAYWASVLPIRVPQTVVENALPLDEIDATRPAAEIGFGLDDSCPLILYLGRFNADKNVANLVDALVRVIAESDAVALLCGIGPELEPIRQRISDAGLAGRVVAPGFVPRPISLLKRASIAISLSRYEGMPNSAMEAAAAGCPQILSSTPAHRAIFDELTVEFVASNSSASISEAMLSILRNPESAAQRAVAAKERSRVWSIANLTSGYERIYQEVLDLSERSR
jgi:glycosyltransferase involved in cell wall biosynthesis